MRKIRWKLHNSHNEPTFLYVCLVSSFKCACNVIGMNAAQSQQTTSTTKSQTKLWICGLLLLFLFTFVCAILSLRISLSIAIYVYGVLVSYSFWIIFNYVNLNHLAKCFAYMKLSWRLFKFVLSPFVYFIMAIVGAISI